MKKSYIYAATAIFFWSTIAAFSKFLLAELNNMQLLWMNSLVGGLFLFIINILSGNFKKKINYTIKDYLKMVAIGLPGAFFYYVFFYAGTDILPASQAFIINYLWPIMSVVFACIILKEKLTAKKAIAIAISFLGVVVVAGASLKDFDVTMLLGVVFCVLGAVSYGLFTALAQKSDYDKSMILMAGLFATFILTTVINAVSKDLFIATPVQVAGFLWNGIFSIAIANTLWVLALSKGETAKISNLAYITPFLSLVWTALFLKEQITLNSVVGLIIIVGGILIQIKDREKN